MATPSPNRRSPRVNRRPGHAPKVYAALDLGTNNCRLLVAEAGRDGQPRIIDSYSQIIRLGEGLAATGQLSPAAMERAYSALGKCMEKAMTPRGDELADPGHHDPVLRREP